MKQKADEGIKARGTAKRKANATAKAEGEKRKRSGFMFYTSWIDDIRKLPLNEQKELIFALVMYGTKGLKPTALSMNTEIYFNFCHRVINYDLDRYGLGSIKTANRTYRSGEEALFSSLTENVEETFEDSVAAERRNIAQTSDSHQRSIESERSEQEADETERRNIAQTSDNHQRADGMGKADGGEEGMAAQRADSEQRTPTHILSITDYGLPIKHLAEEKEEEKSSSKEAEVFASLYGVVGKDDKACAEKSATETKEIKGEESVLDENLRTEGGATAKSDENKKGCETNDAAYMSEAAANGEVAASNGDAPCSLKEAKAYWEEMGFQSRAEEFYGHYEAKGWRTRQGGKMRFWKNAARCWEQYFVKTVYPLRRREAEARETAERAERQVRENRAEWERQRREREAEYERQERRAVSPQEARRLYEEALRQTGGDAAAAIELLKQYRPPSLERKTAQGEGTTRAETAAMGNERHFLSQSQTP
ncbi:hypothetical protein EII14_08060 [Alloprevotella sp. OH1205_COT-284]|uniref:DUF6291 domain-containing protein n=1 Tax=Alloprevotella sp. OH1205_COT-284 TaxID=2491043 RepID=UPI000F5EA683|nr:DUF6291 domain-containing protein [Alloprevotella sp. OH1205_COT-284]RRD76249.1 hypothetical protein EII14_08060 [Alloprevotella sp. OH1205_COT-284]